MGSPSPPRVVVIDSGQLDNVLALGVRPVGAADSPVPGRGFVRYLDTSGIASVGAVNDPDLDRIAALQPDLIVGARIRHVQLESSLVEIAPTLLSESVGGVWQDNLRAVATALSLSQRAEQVLTAYRAHVASAQAAAGPRLATTRISYVRGYGRGKTEGSRPPEVRIYLRRSFAGSVLADLGAARPPAQAEDSARRFVAIAAAHLKDMDGDVLFLSTYGVGGAEALAGVRVDRRWASLTAVRQGQVFEVDDDIWAVGTGPAAANALIDDVVRTIAGIPSTQP